MPKTVIIAMEKQMQKSAENFRNELASLRTGRASIALLEGIKIMYYGSQMSINQVGHVSIPEARTIEIKPWDPMVLPEIEKAIQKSDLGINPNNDGKLIRINIPKLNEDRRRGLVKTIKKISEEYRVSVRNERREAIELIKKSEKEKSITEDNRKTAEHEIQKITDIYIKKIDEIFSHKEKEIMEI